MKASKSKIAGALVAVGVSFLALPVNQASANANIVIVNNNAAGVGFNDPTPAAPVGGNAGTTIGAQRLIAFQEAANIWGSTLDSSVTINVRAQFTPLSCTAGGAVLGSAGPTSVFANFPNAQVAEVWYHNALANKLAREDLNPPVVSVTDGADINANFNSNLGNVGCLTGVPFYYGLDGNEGVGIDLVAVLLHEFGHGLGFSTTTSSVSGNLLAGRNSVYDAFIHDNRTNKGWIEMTASERQASAINSRNVVWTGAKTTATVPSVLSLGTPLLRVNAPAGISGIYAVGTASFGPVLASPGVTGTVVAGLDPSDGAGASTFDACSPLSNAAAVAGNIALVSRGTCGFTVKVKNAQDAGAIAVIVADNAAGGPPAGLGGADASIVIPAVRVTLADGNLLRAQADPINATLGVDMTVYAGADAAGRVLLNNPSPVQSGSSTSHWDPSTFRNQLMEPAINSDLTHSLTAPEDLTLSQMRDIGWFADADLDGVDDATDACLGSTLGGNVVIDSCNSGVTNTWFPNGCSIMDVVDKCGDSAVTHEDFTGCVTHFTNDLKSSILSNKQKASIQRCAAKADIP